jgi:hypothetical protein
MSMDLSLNLCSIPHLVVTYTVGAWDAPKDFWGGGVEDRGR